MSATGNCIYLVMDMINDLVHDEGPSSALGLGIQARTRNVVGNTATALQAARAKGLRIGYVRIGFSEDYRECSSTSRRLSAARERGLFRLGTWGTEIHPALQRAAGDSDFIKRRVSPCYGTDLELMLRVQDIHVVYVSGVSTNGVIHSAARDLHDRDIRCVVLEDCCAAASVEEHANAIACMDGFAEISNSEAAFP